MRTINATMRPGETILVKNDDTKAPMKVVLAGGPTATPPEVTVGAGKTVAIGPFRDEVVTYDEVAGWLRPEIRDAIETALGWGSHGTIAGYNRHQRGRTPVCTACREAARALPSSIRRRHEVEQWGVDGPVRIIDEQDESWQLTQYVRDHWSTSGPVEHR